MTAPDVAVTLVRLEGKVDTLAVKMDAGDRAATQLVELVKTELANVQSSVEELKRTIAAGQDKADTALSRVRVDLEHQIETARNDWRGERQEHKETHKALYGRADRLDRWVNRLIGGCLLASSLGIPGIVALVRGW